MIQLHPSLFFIFSLFFLPSHAFDVGIAFSLVVKFLPLLQNAFQYFFKNNTCSNQVRVLLYDSLQDFPVWKKFCADEDVFEKKVGGLVSIWEVSCSPECGLRALLSGPQLMENGGSYYFEKSEDVQVIVGDGEEEGDEGVMWWVYFLLPCFLSPVLLFLFRFFRNERNQVILFLLFSSSPPFLFSHFLIPHLDMVI